ncbi:hypothetical protein ABE10_00330, partial [Bacillus toyonensis]|nr:hypothetical protein [Bacillus toyonensis]
GQHDEEETLHPSCPVDRRGLLDRHRDGGEERPQEQHGERQGRCGARDGHAQERPRQVRLGEETVQRDQAGGRRHHLQHHEQAERDRHHEPVRPRQPVCGRDPDDEDDDRREHSDDERVRRGVHEPAVPHVDVRLDRRDEEQRRGVGEDVIEILERRRDEPVQRQCVDEQQEDAADDGRRGGAVPADGDAAHDALSFRFIRM